MLLGLLIKASKYGLVRFGLRSMTAARYSVTGGRWQVFEGIDRLDRGSHHLLNMGNLFSSPSYKLWKWERVQRHLPEITFSKLHSYLIRISFLIPDEMFSMDLSKGFFY